MDRTVQVSGRHELLALHRALIEARFNPDPADRDVPCSPFLADLSRRVAAALTVEDAEQAEGWAAWLRLTPERREWDAAVNNVRRCCLYWSGLSPAEKRERAREHLAPFAVTEPDLDQFIAAVDGRSSSGWQWPIPER